MVDTLCWMFVIISKFISCANLSCFILLLWICMSQICFIKSPCPNYSQYYWYCDQFLYYTIQFFVQLYLIEDSRYTLLHPLYLYSFFLLNFLNLLFICIDNNVRFYLCVCFIMFIPIFFFANPLHIYLLVIILHILRG